MRRVPCRPRPDWLTTVEDQGLTYAVDRAATGDTTATYWDESVRYELDEGEVDYLEQVTATLHSMAVEAARRMVADEALAARHGLPPEATELFRRSLQDPAEFSLYGRFDLAWSGRGDAKLLEYNADTPAGLVEAAVCQWLWLEDLHPTNDQWNLIHERMVQAFTRLKAEAGIEVMHFAVGQDEPTEDWATVAYLRDVAQDEAGLLALGCTVEEIGYDLDHHEFVDAAGRAITHCFKMYPTEWLLCSGFGQYILSGEARTRWVEPPWKLLLGSKALLATLWEMFPGHPNLLPAYLDDPRELTAYVSKPLFGWEGDGVSVHTPTVTESTPATHSAGQRLVHQQYVELPTFDGHHPVLGTWVVGGHPAGLGIRESTNLITNTGARFVPHLMTSRRSTPAQVERWLTEQPAHPTPGPAA